MRESKVAPYSMSHDYLNHLNVILTRSGFGPQEQGVTIDWDGLDKALAENYRTRLRQELRDELEAEIRAEIEKEPSLKDVAATRARHGSKKKKKDEEQTEEDDQGVTEEATPDGSE